MNHWPIVPIVLPAVTAALLVLLRPALVWQRAISLVATAALLVTAILLAVDADSGRVAVYALSDWPAPFGIVLALDRLAALMLVLTAVVALCSLLYACAGSDEKGAYFHPLFQFQLMGLNGAFLTGDLFNLFVFFEVLLIASYCLLLHGGGAQRLKSGFHYVAINLTGSALYLIAVALLYGMTGTLNMADMALKVAAAPPADAALIQAGALMLLIVFALKAALLPLYFWLPSAYAAASAPVAALFAIMTKVGVYTIFRVYTLVFGPDAGVAADVAQAWLLPGALATIFVAAIGALASQTLRGMTGYLTIASVGTIILGGALGGEGALGAALYYLVHSTLAVALMFLVADLIAGGRGDAGDSLSRSQPMLQPSLLGWMYFGAAIATAGVPPLSGFIGKLMLLQGAQGHPAALWSWAVVLGAALLMLLTLAQAGIKLFWHVGEAAPAMQTGAHRQRAAQVLPGALLLACIVAWTVLAGPAAEYARAAARQLLAPADYVEDVLGPSPALQRWREQSGSAAKEEGGA